ncbi:MAG: ABC transporter permease [Nitrospinota bacterium]
MGRNSVSAGALMVALSMLVSLTIMVGSFRRTVELWVEQTIRADLFAAPAARFLAGSGATIPGHYLGKARSLPGVLAVDGFRGLQMEWGDGIATFASRELEILEKHATLPFISGDYRKVLKEARERGEAVVSESFSLKHGVRAGDSLTLRTPKGPISLKVAGVFYDYSAQGGMILVDRSLFRRYWQDERVNNLAIYLEPGAEVEAVRERLQALFADESGVLVFTNRFLRERIMRVFDQAFRITYALEVIAFFVAALGVLNALTTNILERRRELAILRSLGFEARGLFRMIVHEAALLGALAGGVGLAGGVFLSLILIFVINVQSFGWSIQLGFPLLKLAEYLALALLVALISGYLPARSAGKVELARALREE